MMRLTWLRSGYTCAHGLAPPTVASCTTKVPCSLEKAGAQRGTHLVEPRKLVAEEDLAQHAHVRALARAHQQLGLGVGKAAAPAVRRQLHHAPRLHVLRRAVGNAKMPRMRAQGAGTGQFLFACAAASWLLGDSRAVAAAASLLTVTYVTMRSRATRVPSCSSNSTVSLVHLGRMGGSTRCCGALSTTGERPPGEAAPSAALPPPPAAALTARRPRRQSCCGICASMGRRGAGGKLVRE